MTVGFSDSPPTLYLVSPWLNRLRYVLFGPRRTVLALPWTTYRVGWLSKNATVMSCFRKRMSASGWRLTSCTTWGRTTWRRGRRQQGDAMVAPAMREGKRSIPDKPLLPEAKPHRSITHSGMRERWTNLVMWDVSKSGQLHRSWEGWL